MHIPIVLGNIAHVHNGKIQVDAIISLIKAVTNADITKVSA